MRADIGHFLLGRKIFDILDEGQSIAYSGLNVNPKSQNIDQVTTTELCQIINNEDATVAEAVGKCIPTIVNAINALEDRARRGGRIIYVGAGTSGRLGVVDASEIPPTYSASPEQFVALIAGGDAALRYAQEGAEDDVVAAENDLRALNIDGAVDSLIGIAASGRTPYVLKCLAFSKSLGCTTIGIACCEPSAMSKEGNVDHMISVVTGPEVVTGSTRMKAGTGTKLVLNMLSTGVMIKLGKTYGNMMIDLKATNEKLQQRARDIIRNICGSSSPSSNDELDTLLAECGGSVKTAVASILMECSVEEAKKSLNNAGGVLAEVLKKSKNDMARTVNSNAEVTQKYVLGVDGGGSKCHAVVLGDNGEFGKGEAEECNVTSVGVVAAISSISLAIQRAVESCPAIKGSAFRSIPFAKVWIGLAGYDRASITRHVDSSLSDLLGLPIGPQLKVTNDIDLLVPAAASPDTTKTIVVLLAGTGSIAMSYEKINKQFERTGRVGGWGSFLGDDGSGFSIGREGLRFALEAAEKFPLRKEDTEATVTVDPLASKVLEHFGLQLESQSHLLDRIMSVGTTSKELGSTNITKRIAGVARVVLDASSSSPAAHTIVENGIDSLLRSLSSLLKSRTIDTLDSSLILAGGLMQNKEYQRLLLRKLSSSGIEFSRIHEAGDPALIAARYMQQQI